MSPGEKKEPLARSQFVSSLVATGRVSPHLLRTQLKGYKHMCVLANCWTTRAIAASRNIIIVVLRPVGNRFVTLGRPPCVTVVELFKGQFPLGGEPSKT